MIPLIKDKKVSDFKNYWENQGVNMTGVNVIMVPVYNENGINRTYESADVSPSLLRRIIPICGSVM